MHYATVNTLTHHTLTTIYCWSRHTWQTKHTNALNDFNAVKEKINSNPGIKLARVKKKREIIPTYNNKIMWFVGFFLPASFFPSSSSYVFSAVVLSLLHSSPFGMRIDDGD